MSKPRLHLHDDGLTLSIGFEDTNDTLLHLERWPGQYEPYEVNRDRGDMKRFREWVEAVDELLRASRSSGEGGATDG